MTGERWFPAWARGKSSRFVAREGQREYNCPTYSVSFRGALIFVALMVAIIVGAILIFA